MEIGKLNVGITLRCHIITSRQGTGPGEVGGGGRGGFER